MLKFNVTETCRPNKHYMVDISNIVSQIKEMIDEGDYFTINRGRQYGKTTTLLSLRTALADDYTMVLISFQGAVKEKFANAEVFCQFLLEKISVKNKPSIIHNRLRIAFFVRKKRFPIVIYPQEW